MHFACPKTIRVVLPLDENVFFLLVLNGIHVLSTGVETKLLF